MKNYCSTFCFTDFKLQFFDCDKTSTEATLCLDIKASYASLNKELKLFAYSSGKKIEFSEICCF